MKRKLVHNPDGTLSCIGWEPLRETEDEVGEHKKPQRKMKRCRIVR